VQGGSAGWTDDKGGAGGGGRIKVFAASTTMGCTMNLSGGGIGCPGGDGSAAGVIDGSLLTAPVIASPAHCSFNNNFSPTTSRTSGAGACSGLSPQVTVSVDGTVLGTASSINCASSPPSWSYSPLMSLTGTVANGSSVVSNVSNSTTLSQGEPIA